MRCEDNLKRNKYIKQKWFILMLVSALVVVLIKNRNVTEGFWKEF